MCHFCHEPWPPFFIFHCNCISVLHSETWIAIAIRQTVRWKWRQRTSIFSCSLSVMKHLFPNESITLCGLKVLMPVTEDVKLSLLQFHIWFTLASTDSQGISFEALALFVWVVTVKVVHSLGVIEGDRISSGQPATPPKQEHFSLTCFLFFCLDSSASNSIGL